MKNIVSAAMMLATVGLASLYLMEAAADAARIIWIGVVALVNTDPTIVH